MSDAGEITQLLVALRAGEPGVYDRLLPLVYDELRRMARAQLRRRRPGQTLETTALVNEAYLKLIDQKRVELNDRGHFMAVASVAMRQILVDYARHRTAQKRGGGEAALQLDEGLLAGDASAGGKAIELLALDQALTALARLNERLVRLVELRFFGGLSVEETATVLEVSPRTVKRDWRKARAFLYRSLSEQRAG